MIKVRTFSFIADFIEKSTFLLLAFALLFCSSCANYPAYYQTDTTEISDAYPPDEELQNYILPFQDSLDQVLDKVIAIASSDLTLKQPESELGNFMCDAPMEFYNYVFQNEEQVDFCIMNYYGIRTKIIPKGDIRIEQIYELMPFENELVIMDLQGNQVTELMQKIAEKGGMPISKNVNLLLKDNVLITALIDGKPIEDGKIYKVLMNDYHAQGGDGMDMFKTIPFRRTDLKLRDALIAYCSWKYQHNEYITSPITGRIIIEE